MHAQVLWILRVFMFVSLYLLLMWFVSCLSSVLVSMFMLYLYSFRSQFSVVGGILFTDSPIRSLVDSQLPKYTQVLIWTLLDAPPPTILIVVKNFARHCGSHWCFQFLASILHGLLKFLVLKVNDINSS